MAAPWSRGNSGRARSPERPEVSLAAVLAPAEARSYQVTRLTLQGAAATAAPSSRGIRPGLQRKT